MTVVKWFSDLGESLAFISQFAEPATLEDAAAVPSKPKKRKAGGIKGFWTGGAKQNRKRRTKK